MTTPVVQTVESQDITLGKLLDDFYVVPSFQREYVWEETHVEQLLEDIYTGFSSDERISSSEYFIGSIVGFIRDDGVYELIDGQQRLTTAFLALCAIRDHLRSINPSASLTTLQNQIAATSSDEFGNDIFRYRVVLQYEDSAGVLEKIADETFDVDDIEVSTRSVRNIITAYHSIRRFLQNEFHEEEDTTRWFYAYLTRNVKLIRVTTLSIAHALKVFETINDRGVGLDSMDLLKNLMFMNTSQSDYDTLKEIWKRLVDTLYNAGEKPLRFLRYFVFAEYGVERLREDQIYKWFEEHEELCGYRYNSLGFANNLLEAARDYAHFTKGEDQRGQRNRYLANIRQLSGAARQHLILLLGGRHLPPEVFNELCRQLENLLFVFIITREPQRELERRFPQWTSDLKKVRDLDALEEFVNRRFVPAKLALADRFDLAFRDLNEGSIQIYRMKYVLAKLTQYVNEQAWGSTPQHSDLGYFINSGVEIEHIFPRKPAADVLADFDRPDEVREWVHQLGNLTLLEKSINASIRNGRFTAKQEAYSESNFLLTRSLGKQVSIGKNTAVDRAVSDLELFESWSTVAIDRRQKMLVRLSRHVWDMPPPRSEMVST